MTKPTGTTWAHQQKLIPSDSEAGALFGWACAISSGGDRVVIGAYSDDATGGANSGAAYVFTRSGSTWSEEAKLIPASSQSNAQYGHSVAIDRDGTRIVVGAPYHDTAGGFTNAGEAFVWTRTGTSWAEEATLVATNPGLSYYFGWSCSIDANGERIIVGHRSAQIDGTVFAGSAYIFARSPGTTVWTEETEVFGTLEASAYFGESCSISGDGMRALVGAMYEDAGATDAGAVYFFQRTYLGWSANIP